MPTTTAQSDAPEGPRPAAETRRRRLFADRLARRVVTLGGLLIIASILGIFVVIAAETYPLFRPASATPLAPLAVSLDGTPLAVAVDEYGEVLYWVSASGIHFASLRDGALIATRTPAGMDSATIVAASGLSTGTVALGLSDGRALLVPVSFPHSYVAGSRTVAPDVGTPSSVLLDPAGRAIRLVAHSTASRGPVTAAALSACEIAIVSVSETKPLIGAPVREEWRQTVTLPVEGEITALAIDERGEQLYAGGSTGQIVRVALSDPASPRVAGVTLAPERAGVGVSVLGFLLGDRTLIVGDTAGGVSSWQLLRGEGEEATLTRVHRFARHAAAVAAFAASQRDKGFITADRSGHVALRYGTTGQTLLRVDSDGGASATLAPKGDSIVAWNAAGGVARWSVANPHPEATLPSLFGKVWYEGYDAPAYVWQSTGGTDDFEAKLSLVPLVFGTVKGTFYALIFAIPIALSAALYTSQFMHPTLCRAIKPMVEIMAALPSVVLGFIAGLWLAPAMERVIPAVFLMPLILPAAILIAYTAWRLVPGRITAHLHAGSEAVLLVPVVLAAAALSVCAGRWLEQSFLSGDYRSWLSGALGLTYDQRNSLVVGFAMGFAVIPIIFTIAEDSLSNVPPHLAAGSLALGATRWQTAVRIVLPTASPGIFSAVMIGFGRAVGETMIVLMATGNTPLMDGSPFNGFRALSANIAVEMPEAPAGGTLYRVLFLAALLLFAMTFVVNTLAELVRLRLRRRYRYL